MNKTEIIPQATMVESNHGGIEISLTYSNDSLYWRRNWGDNAISEWKEAEIEYSDIDNDGESFEDNESQPYFRLDDGGWKYFLNQFMRIEL